MDETSLADLEELLEAASEEEARRCGWKGLKFSEKQCFSMLFKAN